MSSKIHGFQTLLRKDVPNAVYIACHSHNLNLVIALAFKLSQTRKCISVVNESFLFFDAFFNRQGFFKSVIDIGVERKQQLVVGRKQQNKLKSLCKTRWVARFKAIHTS